MESSTEPHIEVIVSPTRTCVGVVLGTAIALGAAAASGGDFIDMEIHMLHARPIGAGPMVVRTHYHREAS